MVSGADRRPLHLKLGDLLLLASLIDHSLAVLANSIMTIRLCLVPMEIGKALLDLAGLASFSYGTFHFTPQIIKVLL